MSVCTFKFKIDSDVAELLKKINLQIESEGGTFKGDENGGYFSLSTPVGEIEGNYTVIGDDLKIDITKKPPFLPCSLLENEFKNRMIT